MAKDSVRKKKAKLRQLRYERRKILMSKLKYSGNKLFLVVYIILLAGIGTFLISTFTDTYKPVITGFAGSYECSNQATVDGVFLTTNLTDLTTNTETNFSV